MRRVLTTPMAQREQFHIVPFTAAQMFDLVADIETYPAFVPYCTGLRVLRRKGEPETAEITAQMIVQYRIFREQFKCRVQLDQPNLTIHVDYVEGPIRTLKNRWRFTDLAEGGSRVDFAIDFEFKSFVLQQLSNRVFDKAFTHMSDAFVTRAHALYTPTIRTA